MFMKLRSILVLGVAMLAMVAQAGPLKYVIKVKGEKTGTVTTETTGNPEDGFTDDTTIEMAEGGRKGTIRIVTKYDKTGTDSSKTMTISFGEGDIKVAAKLSDSGAEIKVTTDDGATDDQEIKTTTNTSRVDETYFWFKTIKPEVDKKVTYHGFDIQEGVWRDVTHQYKGKEKIKIGDKEIEAHKVLRTEDEEETTVYLDDKGELLVYINDDTRIERVFEATDGNARSR